MATSVNVQSKMEELVSAVREFNRFYTARLGLLRRRHLDGEFSLTEARILYEIGASRLTTASALRDILELDAGYLSRVLAALTRRKLVRQVTSKTDGREKRLTLTTLGERMVAQLNQQSNAQLRNLLADMSATDRQVLVASLHKVREILTAKNDRRIRIERLTAVRTDALAILQEY
jgi:DNA-binding MarR family transcriptional regulator